MKYRISSFDINFNFLSMNKLALLLIVCTLFCFQNTGKCETPQSSELKIMTIGDSNGTFEYSWPKQLAKLIPNSTIVNRSISGNTIGFDNNGREDLNTLKNILRYLDEAYQEIGSNNNFDYILINLGTNDTKVVFNERQDEVYANFVTLIGAIKKYLTKNQKSGTKIGFITPAPMDEEKAKKEKYGGGDERIQKNNEHFKLLAAKHDVLFINTYDALKVDFSSKTSDGVHLNESAQLQMAEEIVKQLY